MKSKLNRLQTLEKVTAPPPEMKTEFYINWDSVVPGLVETYGGLITAEQFLQERAYYEREPWRVIRLNANALEVDITGLPKFERPELPGFCKGCGLPIPGKSPYMQGKTCQCNPAGIKRVMDGLKA
jgi:hypothetical protein